MHNHARLIFAATTLLLSCAGAPLPQPAGNSPPTPDQRLEQLAQRLVAMQVEYAPASAYSIGVPAPDHRRWADVSPQAISAFEQSNDAILAELQTIERAGL